jgi:hypothetical protein
MMPDVSSLPHQSTFTQGANGILPVQRLDSEEAFPPFKIASTPKNFLEKSHPFCYNLL